MNTKESNTKTKGIEPYIIECMCMRLSEREALNYLDKRGYSISRTELYRLKNEIKDSMHERLNLIASKEFLEQHIERIDTLKTILNEMWLNYHKEKNPLKKVQILEKIEENQLYLSSYYDSTRYVMEQAAKVKQLENSTELKKKRKKEEEVNQI